MLEGITILNQEMIMVPPEWYGVLAGRCIIGLICGLLIVLISLAIDHVGGLLAIGATMIIGFGVCGLIGSLIPSNVESGRYRYEVTIDESVSFSDIYEKYEIVEQRGEIWVLEEKEKE